MDPEQTAANNERVKAEFCETAIESYISGRFAYHYLGNRLAGHLLHRSVEYGLKAVLVGEINFPEFKGLSHFLPKLLDEAVRVWPSLGADGFVRTAAELDVWDKIRYPKEKLEVANVLLGDSALPSPELADSPFGALPVVAYRIELGKIDALMAEILRALGSDPHLMFGHLSALARRVTSERNAEESILNACADPPQ